jgi:hypothetical protein
MTSDAGISTRLGIGEQTEQVWLQADDVIVVEAHVERIETPPNNPTLLVQPGGQHPGLGALRDLLNPAKQGNVGAVDIAPQVMGRWLY